MVNRGIYRDDPCCSRKVMLPAQKRVGEAGACSSRYFSLES